MMQFLKASTDIYIPEKNIKYISDCNGKVIKKLVLEKKKDQKCFDATHGKEIKVFGESHIDEIAAELKVPVLGKMPIDMDYATKADGGFFAAIDNQYIDRKSVV